MIIIIGIITFFIIEKISVTLLQKEDGCHSHSHSHDKKNKIEEDK